MKNLFTNKISINEFENDFIKSLNKNIKYKDYNKADIIRKSNLIENLITSSQCFDEAGFDKIAIILNVITEGLVDNQHEKDILSKIENLDQDITNPAFLEDIVIEYV